MLRDTLKWWPGQVEGLHAILCNYTDWAFSLPFFPLISPKGHIRVQAIFPVCHSRMDPSAEEPELPQAGKDMEMYCAQLPFSPHILWMHGHTSAPAIETMNYPCWLQSFRLKHDSSSSGINASRAPCSHARSLDSLGLYVHI